jgi:hypothetical protein
VHVLPKILVQRIVAGLRLVDEPALHLIVRRDVDGRADDRVIAIHVARVFARADEAAFSDA